MTEQQLTGPEMAGPEMTCHELVELVTEYLEDAMTPAARAQDVQFVHCVPTSPGALSYQCSLAAPCTASPCPASATS